MMMEMLLLTQVAEVPQYSPPVNAVVLSNTDLILICVIWLVVGLIVGVLPILLLSPDTLLIIAAKVLRRPLLMIHYADRHTILKLGKKTSKEHMGFVESGKIYRIDSRIYREGKADNYRGIDLLHYFINSLFPMGAGESKAVADAVKYVRTATWPDDVYEEDSSQTETVVSETGEMVTRNKRVLVHKKGDPKFPFLNTLSDKALVTALFMPDDELEADVKVFVKIDTHGLSREEAERKKKNFGMGIIEDCRLSRIELSSMHIPSGGFIYQTASQLVNNNLTPQLVDDLAKAMMNLKIDWGRQIAQIAPWIALIVAIFIAGALGFKIATG